MSHYTRGLEGRIISSIEGSVAWITHEDELEELKQSVTFYNPDAEVLVFPEYDVLPYSGLSPSRGIVFERISTLLAIGGSIAAGKKVVLLISIAAMISVTVPQKLLYEHVRELRVGMFVERSQLIASLVALGFVRLGNAVDSGEFAVRGSILDVVLQGQDFGYRLDFFGNTIDSIKKFDLQTQRTVEPAAALTITPCNELIYHPDVLDRGVSAISMKLGIMARKWMECFKEGRTTPGQEMFLGLFYGVKSNIISYLNDNFTLLLHEDFAPRVQAQYGVLDRRSRDVKVGSKQEAMLALEPGDLCCEYDEIITATAGFKQVILDYFAEEREALLFDVSDAGKHKDLYGKLKYISTFVQKDYVVVGCNSEATKQKIADTLGELGVAVHYSYSHLKLQAGVVNIAILPLKQSIYQDGLLMLSELGLIGHKTVASRKEGRRDKREVFSDLSSFTTGEFVVHKEHGIGEFVAIESLDILGIVRDFVKLMYAGGDRLFIPVENLELLSKYGAESGVANLDKLGAVAWQTRKANLKKRIKMAAQELLKIAAVRMLAKAPIYECEHGLYEEFCSTFGHIETQDQLNAFEDIRLDMLKGRPMDRLICGDVGFGKTEVALRAAFLIVASSQSGNHKPQVVVLVPTTLLARQHYATFSKRFERFGIKVRQLSKFTPRKDVKAIKQELAEGQLDIIIGTHALLAKGLSFANVGMVIIDEEQHFGVKQKERLREIKESTHVLTLSATPIPRTLHLAMSGIKDLSIIATPPFERLPIKTFAAPFNIGIVRDAITKEMSRNGRVFYITPRVSYLDEIVSMLNQLMPEIKVGKAHGGMSSGALDEVMNQFYDGDFEVLVCTTIVESGLDIPAANTIIMDRAHLFGLAQLYQIRGRVGRSNVQSYAYLTYPNDTLLSTVARKRLEIICSYDKLGAGFSIANHDMDIRGYGNLVGEEQSGCIKEVGLELYQSMLESAIADLQGAISYSEGVVQDSVTEAPSPILNLGVSIQIPEDYVDDTDTRLSLYRRVAGASNSQDVDDLELEIIDRFGPLPDGVKHLLKVIKLKILAKKAGISKLDVTEKGIVITFYQGAPQNVTKVLDFIASNSLVAKLKEDNKIFIKSLGEKDADQVIRTIEQIIRQISE